MDKGEINNVTPSDGMTSGCPCQCHVDRSLDALVGQLPGARLKELVDLEHKMHMVAESCYRILQEVQDSMSYLQDERQSVLELLASVAKPTSSTRRQEDPMALSVLIEACCDALNRS